MSGRSKASGRIGACLLWAFIVVSLAFALLLLVEGMLAALQGR